MPLSMAMTKRSPHAARSAEISLGIRSARALALAKRAQSGRQLNQTDSLELEELATALTGAADAVAKEPKAARLRGKRNLASVGLALSTAARGEGGGDPERAAEILRSIAGDLHGLAEGQTIRDADPVLGFLRALVDAANRSTARQGETLVSAKG